MDGGRTDGHLRPALGRLGGVDLKNLRQIQCMQEMTIAGKFEDLASIVAITRNRGSIKPRSAAGVFS